jgi:acetyltransferase-like isoleucine patch superfamily enzyme
MDADEGNGMKQALKRLLHTGLPVPSAVRPLIATCYRAGVVVVELLRWLYAFVIAAPVMRSIAEVGEQLRIERIPYIRGLGRVSIGDRVYLSGKINIGFSSRCASPGALCIGDDTFIGHNSSFTIGKRIEIGSHVLIAGGIRVQDNDGHPLDADRRHAGEPVAPEDVKPVTISDGAWIGHSCMILKSVTIGENAVIGAGSVVTSDVPANTVVAGVPARVIREAKAEK